MMDKIARLKNIIPSIIMVIIIIVFVVEYKIHIFYNEVLRGFWNSEQMLIYIDTNKDTIRIMEISENGDIVKNDKLNVIIVRSNIIPTMSLYKRSFSIQLRNDQKQEITTDLGKYIELTDVTLDVYGSEGVMIVSNKDSDLFTLTSNVDANLEMITSS